MKKWNIAGLLVFVAISAITLWGFSKDDGTIPSVQSILFVLGGVALIGIDRFAGGSRYGVFPVTLLWTAYWGVVSFGFLSMAGLYGFVLGFGHGNSANKWIAELFMYGYAGIAVLFGGLAASNLIRFFVALFSLPKLEH